MYSLFRRKMPKDFKHMSLLQYSIMQFLLLTMIALPVKMAFASAVAHQVRVDYAVVQCLSRS